MPKLTIEKCFWDFCNQYKSNKKKKKTSNGKDNVSKKLFYLQL